MTYRALSNKKQQMGSTSPPLPVSRRSSATRFAMPPIEIKPPGPASLPMSYAHSSCETLQSPGFALGAVTSPPGACSRDECSPVRAAPRSWHIPQHIPVTNGAHVRRPSASMAVQEGCTCRHDTMVVVYCLDPSMHLSPLPSFCLHCLGEVIRSTRRHPSPIRRSSPSGRPQRPRCSGILMSRKPTMIRAARPPIGPPTLVCFRPEMRWWRRVPRPRRSRPRRSRGSCPDTSTLATGVLHAIHRGIPNLVARYLVVPRLRRIVPFVGSLRWSPPTLPCASAAKLRV